MEKVRSQKERERCKQINFQPDTILFSERNLFSQKGRHLNIRHRYSIFHIYSQNEEKWEFSLRLWHQTSAKRHNIKPEREREREREKCSVTFENLLFHPTLFAPRKRSVRVAFHRVLVFRKAEIRFSRNTIANDSYVTRWCPSLAIYWNPLSNIRIVRYESVTSIVFSCSFIYSRNSLFPRQIYRFLGDESCWFVFVLVLFPIFFLFSPCIC